MTSDKSLGLGLKYLTNKFNSVIWQKRFTFLTVPFTDNELRMQTLKCIFSFAFSNSGQVPGFEKDQE